MKNTNLKICDAIIQPGETVNLALPLPDYNACTSLFMPIKVVHGKEQGPCVLIFSGLEGNEFNGVKIINHLLKLNALNQLRGTLIAVPIMNILGLINTLPNEKNLGDCFPGDVQGSYSERIAHIFTQEIFSKATHCIEIKTGALNADSLPQIYCDLDNEEAKKLAKRFAAPVISHVNNNANSFRKTAYDLNIPLLVYKAGEAMRFNEDAIKMGITGIENMLDSLDMITLDESLPDTFKPVFSLEQDWVRAHCSGILMTDVSLGQFVEKNQEIAQITDPFSADTVEPVRCPQDGIIVAINRNPLMSEGQNIIKMASFIDNNRAELTLEQWNKIQQED